MSPFYTWNNQDSKSLSYKVAELAFELRWTQGSDKEKGVRVNKKKKLDKLRSQMVTTANHKSFLWHMNNYELIPKAIIMQGPSVYPKYDSSTYILPLLRECSQDVLLIPLLFFLILSHPLKSTLWHFQPISPTIQLFQLKWPFSHNSIILSYIRQ